MSNVADIHTIIETEDHIGIYEVSTSPAPGEYLLIDQPRKFIALGGP